MKIICTCFFLILIITTEFSWGGQQIETVVFPSEDEIVEALSLGEISIEQFYILTELISNRVMPSSFLLDEIPGTLLRIDTTFEDSDQAQYFITSKNKRTSKVLLHNRYASYLDEDASTRLQSSLLYNEDNFEFNMILKKEFSGRERFIRRYVSYQSLDKSYQIIVGNFSKRFGLGGVVGFRGKLVSYSDEIDDESFLFPDYGGFNGLYAQKKSDNNLLETVLSYNRDANFSIITKSFMFTHKKLPSFIVAQNEIKNRDSSQTFHDLKTSLYKKITYSNGKIAFEMVTAFNSQYNSAAMLLDGSHKVKQQYLKYSLWKYGDEYLDISGGSKTSLISEKIVIDSSSVNYDMSSKRSNQIGGVLKYKIAISPLWDIDIASLYAYKNSDTTELQFFGKLRRRIKSTATVSIDVLFRRKIRFEIDSNQPEDKFQQRLLFVYSPEKFYVRTYLSYVYKTDVPSYVGFFSEFKIKTIDYGRIHLWLNLNRFNYHTREFTYFYGFIKNEISLYKALFISFKLSHRYNRLTSDKYQNQFSVDMRWTI